MNNKNSSIVTVISLTVAALSIFCALSGLSDKDLYGNILATGVFKPSFMPGTISQDIVAFNVSVAMLILAALHLKRKDGRTMISMIGLLSFYFYGYGTYTISALYTSLYLVYMLIFALSMVGIIAGSSGFARDYIESLHLPEWIRISSIGFLSLIVLIFAGKWLSDLIPHTQSHTIPEFYAIYILDLCVVLPLFCVIIYMLARNKKLAYPLLGVALLKTTTLILAVTIGSFLAPKYGTPEESPMIFIYFAVTAVSLFLFVFYNLKIEQKVRG